MNKLTVINQNGKLLIDSREVALLIEKPHDQLMRNIRTHIEHLDSAKLQSHDFFIPSTYINTQNKEQPCYLLSKKGCDLIANKMTGTKGTIFTAIYVTRFEEMANQLNVVKQIQVPQTLQEALRAYADTLDEKEKLEAENKVLAPKAQKYEDVMGTGGCRTVSQVARLLEPMKNNKKMGVKLLFEYLRDKGYLMPKKTPKSVNQAYQEYINKELFMHHDVKTDSGKVVLQVLVTRKGIDILIDELRKDGYTVKKV
jgi:Rha family phage regulatory protein